MLLHFLDHGGELCSFELRPRRPRGAEVWLSGSAGQRRLARFGTMSEAIEAVDYELPKRGDPASARPEAAWRQQPLTPELAAAVAELRPPRRARTVGEALAHLVLVDPMTES